MSKLQIFTRGIIKENPVLVLLLGTCPTLAVTTMAINGLGMGAATTFVLLGSNIVIALLKNIIPDKVRIPCYIVIIAGFVTIVQMMIKALSPDLDAALGIFLPLIVVNCIILGRAEMFASKNSVIDSTIDALGMGAGFTLALFFMGSIREILGSGTLLATTAFEIDMTSFLPSIGVFVAAPGGFFVFGCLIALVNKLTDGKAIKKKEFGCEGCPGRAACNREGCN